MTPAMILADALADACAEPMPWPNVIVAGLFLAFGALISWLILR